MLIDDIIKKSSKMTKTKIIVFKMKNWLLCKYQHNQFKYSETFIQSYERKIFFIFCSGLNFLSNKFI
jgi:hypothetical protein